MRNLPNESADALGQLGVEHDLGLENLGDWAVLLGVSRQIGELGLVEVGHFGMCAPFSP